MSYTNTAYANVTNTSGVPLKSVTLCHQYSDDPIESKTWTDVPAGGTTSPPLTVGYNTGFIRFGQDQWWAMVMLLDGSTWESSATLTEVLHAEDQGTTKTFTISGSILTGFRGGTLQLTLSKAPNYNAWAAVVLRNDFPVSADVLVEHRYSGDVIYDHRWPLVEPGATTPAETAFIVYFNTGFIHPGSDYWNVVVQLDVPPYDNAPASAFDPFPNATPYLACMLKASDNGKTHVFSVGGPGPTLGIASGPCSDQWKTWNGYNTLAFVRIKNDFGVAIWTVLLTHRYSDDSTWRQTRAMLPPGESSPWMVAEYNTGFIRFGSDYWNVCAYLADRTWYANYKTDKMCMLKLADAVTPSTFSVSPSTFTLGLASGPCTDSMLDRGTFLPYGGRDLTKRYDQNAYIGSHNAFANFEAGFWYAQQTASIFTQLCQGATTLLLDIWYDSDERGHGDICLMHAGAGVLQPFAVTQRLSTALAAIRSYLQIQRAEPVTIIFEDKVEPEHQQLIRRAFETSGTWDMVFNPDEHDVDQHGWPTLAEFFALRKPLIVLTSNRRSADFAWQWKYMSENVYGDASLDPATWLDPRSESQPLNQLALCALNHFPTFSVAGFKLPAWIAKATEDNATGLVWAMIDACHTRWGRYPNYINADFWEVPPGEVIETTIRLNGKLHGTQPPVLRMQNGYAITGDIDHSRLLRGTWGRAARWIDHHLGEICPQPDPGLPGPLVHQLGDAVNLTLVVTILHSMLPPGEATVRPWTRTALRHLVRYLLDIEPAVLQALSGEAGGYDQLCAIPYFLIERACDITFAVTGAVRSRAPALSASADHDRLLLAGLADVPGAAGQLAGRLAASRTATTEARTTSRVYDLTHEILYLHHITPGTAAESALAAHLEDLLGRVMPVNHDLGAELLACYWLAGGTPGAVARTATGQLKTASDDLPGECEGDRDGECDCPRFKEQIHNRLTMALGLGATLAAAGEILSQDP